MSFEGGWDIVHVTICSVLCMALNRGIWKMFGSNSAWRGVAPKEHFVGRSSSPVACFISRGISTKLFVSGLSFYTTEKSFVDAFSRFGRLVEARIIMDRVAQRSKGYGFVQYASQEEADEAIKGMDGKFLDGRVIFVEVARSKSELGGPSPQDVGPPDLSRETIGEGQDDAQKL